MPFLNPGDLGKLKETRTEAFDEAHAIRSLALLHDRSVRARGPLLLRGELRRPADSVARLPDGSAPLAQHRHQAQDRGGGRPSAPTLPAGGSEARSPSEERKA